MRAQNGGFELEALPSCLGLAQYGLHDAALLWRKNCGPKPSISDAVCETQNPSVLFPKHFANVFFPLKNAQRALNQATRGTRKTMVVPSDVCGSFIAVISKKSINFKQPPSAYSLLCCRVPHFGRRVIVGARLGQRKAKAAFFS